MTDDVQEQLDVPLREMQCSDFPERINMAKFGAFNETIISVDGIGRIQKWDTETGKILQNVSAHDDAILAFDFDAKRIQVRRISILSLWFLICFCRKQLATASLDCSATLWDVKTLKPIRSYVTNIPVRAVSISPYNDHLILAGGQDAKARILM